MSEYPRILFLDDRRERVRHFIERCGLPVVVVRTANQAKFWLASTAWDVVFLDHDLNDECHSSSPESNSGTHLVRWMAEWRPKCERIVIHSTNHGAAQSMQEILRSTGYERVFKAQFEDVITSSPSVYWLFWFNLEPSDEEQELIRELSGRRFLYRRVGYDERPMALQGNRQVGEGRAGKEQIWDVCIRDGCPTLTLASSDWPTCYLHRDADGVWRGQWLEYEKMQVELVPLL